MRTAALPVALLAASIGLMLSYSAPKDARKCSLMFVAAAVLVVLIPLPGLSDDLAFTGGWLSLMATAASVHLPFKYQSKWVWILPLNAGIWAGLVTHVEGGAMAAVTGLPLVLLFIPGQMVVARNWGIAIKVACSWLIAIAALEIGLNFVETPGYKPDHME